MDADGFISDPPKQIDHVSLGCGYFREFLQYVITLLPLAVGLQSKKLIGSYSVAVYDDSIGDGAQDAVGPWLSECGSEDG